MDAQSIAFAKPARAQRVGQAIAPLLDLAEREAPPLPLEPDLVGSRYERMVEELKQIHVIPCVCPG